MVRCVPLSRIGSSTRMELPRRGMSRTAQGRSLLGDALQAEGRVSSGSSMVETALANAERKGFRLAVIGRTCALVAIAGFYLTALRYPNNIYVPGLLLAVAAVGLAPLALVGSRYERMGRYAFFALDTMAVSTVLAVVPL